MSRPDSKNISATLAAATCALLGVQPAEAGELQAWTFDTALLYYGEDNDRVQDISANILATRQFVDDRSLSLGLAVDALTGATPSGAIQQPFAQTFTRPSGNDVYTVPADQIPLDDTFRDTRIALTANWTQPLGRLYTISVGATASNEYDYTHAGLNATLARDFNQRNTTLSAGFAFARDEIDPVGGTPDPLSPMGDVGDLGNRSGSQSKDVTDLVVGLTQVVSRNAVMQLNYSYSDASGYLTDPYKILSVVDPVTGITVPRTPTPDTEGPSHEFRFESRPGSRAKHSIYGQWKQNLGGKVLDASYRFMTDDWKIDSHTFDARFRWPLGGTSYIEPHIRYYTQTEAEFYRVSLAASTSLPAFASSDYRLGRFDAITAGLKYGWTTGGGDDVSVRLELYRQRGDVPGTLLIGDQVSADAFPDLDAVILQLGYRF